MEETSNQAQTKSNLMAQGLIAIAVVALIGIGVFMYMGKNKEKAMEVSPTTAPVQTEEAMEEDEAMEGAEDGMAMEKSATDSSSSETTMMEKGTYKDGTYDATGAYISPAGPEEIEVSLTLKDGVVTEADVQKTATHQISTKRQEAFIAGYKELVVGKNIDELNLSKVAGSSLTTKGFNDALEAIKEEAKG